MFLICVRPKSLEGQNETVHPIRFSRWDEQPVPSVTEQIHALRLVVLAGVEGRLIVKTDENLKSNPLDHASIPIFERGSFKSLRQVFRSDHNWVTVSGSLGGKYQLAVIKRAINRSFQLFGNPSPNLYWIVNAVNDGFYPWQNMLSYRVPNISYLVVKETLNKPVSLRFCVFSHASASVRIRFSPSSRPASVAGP
jgi:hypothetical protein